MHPDAFAEIHPPLGPRAAAVEANRCLYCFDAPCTAACPTHIDVPMFIKKIAAGNTLGAAQTILDANILGLSCSRVCPVGVLCEGACVMHRYNKQPIEIGRLQRHAMDHFYASGIGLQAGPERSGRVACIGAGPASLACAAELRRRGLAVTLIDKSTLAGGLNTYGVAEYKLRPADSLKEVELIRGMGAEFRLGLDAASLFPELETQFDVIFIGAGLGDTRALGIPGEDLPGVIDALRFIAAYKTNGTAPIGRRVVVIGGGNTAIDAAVASRRLGAEEVHMVYRRGPANLSAFDHEADLARREGVRFHFHLRPQAILGAAAVEAAAFTLGSSTTVRIDCDTVIPSVGQSRLLDLLSRFHGVELRDGCVIVDSKTGRTTNPRYYAGGDCVNGGREVVDAAAEGKRAAVAISEALHG